MIGLLGNILDDQYIRLSSIKKNYQGICKILGKDTIAVVIKYKSQNNFRYAQKEISLSDYKSGKIKSDYSLLSYAFNNVGIEKDSLEYLTNKDINFKIAQYKRHNDGEINLISYYYPVKIEELKGLRKLKCKITGELKKTQKTFDKILQTLPECEPEELDFK
jgi:hypothetical protein